MQKLSVRPGNNSVRKQCPVRHYVLLNHVFSFYIFSGMAYSNFSEKREAFLDEVEESTARGRLIPPLTLVDGLNYCSRARPEQRVAALLGQVGIAKERREQTWLRRVAQEAEKVQFHNRSWIRENIYDIGGKKTYSKPSKETPARTSRDIRLGFDPTIEYRVENASPWRKKPDCLISTSQKILWILRKDCLVRNLWR